VASGYSHYGASFARKSLIGWMSHSASADEDIADNIKVLRERSRDLYMGSPLATGAIKTIRTNVIGSGLMLQTHIDRDKLGLTEEQAIAWQKSTEREWLLWADDVNCDAARMCTFYEFQALALLSCLMSGDCFVALPFIKRPNCPYDLRLDLIESDRICNPFGVELKVPESSIVEGVEVGQYGEPVAYYVARHHPGSLHLALNEKQDWKRVPAFGAKSGRRNMLHLMSDIERPGQRRGVPLLAPVIEALKQLGRYTDAELVAAVVSGYFTVFITQDNQQNGLDSMLTGMPGADVSAMTADPNDVSLGNGAVVSLAEGEKIETANPGRPNTAFDGFVTAICRQIGAALELPYELLMKNFTSSYSASRGALLEAWKMFRMRRQWIINRLCQPVYEEWLAEAVAKGRVQAPGFFDDPAIKKAWCQADWSGDTQGQLDPLKEASAAKLRVEEGFSTREREAAELTGMSFDVIAAQRGREEKLMTENGIKQSIQPTLSTEGNNHDETDSAAGD
jgi:lambda family phage portal protein